MSNPRATRSNYFIKAGLQIKFTFVIVMIVLLVATITFFNLYIIGDYVVQNSSSLIELRDMKSFIYTVFSIVGWRIVTLGVVCFFILAIIGIFYSHQFAGPSYKLEKCLREISAGNLSFRIQLRSGDALHNVADSVNYLVDQFRGVVEQSRSISEELQLKSEGLEGKEVESFRAKLTELQDLMAGFHLSQEEIDAVKLTSNLAPDDSEKSS